MQDEIENIALSKPSLAFSIFCGTLKVPAGTASKIKEKTGFVSWQTHVFEDNSANINCSAQDHDRSLSTIHNLQNYFYPSFVNCIIPLEKNINPFCSFLQGFTLKIDRRVLLNEQLIHVEYLDLFFFPGDLLIYCFKCDYSGLSLNEIIDTNKKVRKIKPEQIDFLCHLFNELDCPIQQDFGNKHKIFTTITHDLELTPFYSSDDLLYDLATCSPVGSSVGFGINPSAQPSRTYLEKLMSCNKVSVFQNWSALCLFDSFTVISKGRMALFDWEFICFRMLYVHSLFIKGFLVEINKKFFLGTGDKNLEEELYEFNKHFNFKEVSFNFLPQILYDKIRYGLNIEHELSDITTYIQKDHNKTQEKRHFQEVEREKTTNKALFIVAILAVFTSIWDGAELIETIVTGKNGFVFSSISLMALCFTYLAIYYILRKK